MRKQTLSRFIQLLAILTIFLFIAVAAGCSSGNAASSNSLSISDVKVSNTTETTAVISWNTDAPATSTVAYGESSQNLSNTPLDEELVISHSVNLSGLTPDTTYFFKVASGDNPGNEVVSGEIETFTTLSPADTNALVIYEIAVSEITESGATISWVTDEPATSQVEYGTSDDDTQKSDLFTEFVTNHLIFLTGLEPNITYHLRIKSIDNTGNEAVSEDIRFTTNPDTDTTPPIISDTTITNITDRTATISWATDEQATGNIEYGTDNSYGSSAPTPEDTVADMTSHSLTLSGLSPDTTYHFKVKSSDNTGNETVSEDQSFTTSPTTVDTVVTFPDANLEAAVREAIGKAQGDIFDSDLVSLIELDAGRSILGPVEDSISDLTGLDRCSGLIELNLSRNQISNLSPLSSLTNLTDLDLYGNQISDISPLSSLTSLTSLRLSGNQVSDLSPLTNLTSLTNLSLGSNQISDISPLSSLTSLTNLYLFDNQISVLQPLSSLTSLTDLDLYGNQISDISPLSSLTSLTSLSLNGNQVSDISSMSSLASLTELNLGSNQIIDISSLSSLTALSNLKLNGNQIVDIEPLVNNSGLREGDIIDLRENPLSNDSLEIYIPALGARGVCVYISVSA